MRSITREFGKAVLSLRALLVLAILVGLVPTAVAGDTTVIVSPINANGWSYTNFGTTASQAFDEGPDVTPAGIGSVSFWHEGPAGYNRGTLHTVNLNGVYLRDLETLTYWGYQMGSEALLYQPPYLQLFLDLDDDGFVDDGIGFEPAWQTGGRYMVPGLQETLITSAPNTNVEQNGLASTGGGVAANTWWKWDLLLGSWWGRGGFLSTGTHRLGIYQCWADGCVTIAGILEVYPNARIVSQAGVTGTGGVRLQYGFGGNSHEYVGHVDKLVVGFSDGNSITYDFELGPTSKDECKNGGWIGYFKNQGQCVSYFVSNRTP
jgi:hypothetical protein